jgi:DNA-binding MarR family transcriptional regulator
VEESYSGVNRENVAEGLELAAILTLRHLSDRTGMGLTANLTLGTLERGGPARVTALAAAASIRQPAMTELVQRLHRQNLVTRVDDPGDGRAALVTITDAGRALLDDIRRDRRDRLAELLVTLPADEEITLTLAMHVALPVIRRLIDDAQQPRTQTDTDTRSVGRGLRKEATSGEHLSSPANVISAPVWNVGHLG